MLRLKYLETCIDLSFEYEGELVKVKSWYKYIKDHRIINVVNDLLANGIAEKNGEEHIAISYKELDNIDDFTQSILSIVDFYPYDIYVSIKGTGLGDLNKKISISFQDDASLSGSGNEFSFKRKGAYLQNDKFQYLLSLDQYNLIEAVDFENEKSFESQNDSMVSSGTIKGLAIKANACLAKIFRDTEIIEVDKLCLNPIRYDDGIHIQPEVKDLDKDINDSFNNKFEKSSSVRNDYSIRDSNNIKNRLILNKGKFGSENTIQKELKKIKNKSIYSEEELSEIIDNSQDIFNSECIDIDNFSKRVIELGIYKPKFYPFISPYKSEWIPGIAIKDKIGGDKHIPIRTKEDVLDLKNAYQKALEEGGKSILYEGEEIPIDKVADIVENAEKQLDSPSKPIIDEKSLNKKEEKKVLIIKENTLELEFKEKFADKKINKFNFEEVENLSEGIVYKDHQREGIGWMQTMAKDPINAPGCLLADDMGLGKTIQVLSFIEWYSKKTDKPFLIIAPVALLENWEQEHVKFFKNSSLKINRLWGKSIYYHFIRNDKEQTLRNFKNNNIYLSTYETLRKQQLFFGMIDWSAAILDEVQKIKTPGTMVTNSAKALKADFKIAMTGTPVENSLMDLWCIVDFCCPGLLNTAKDFSKKYQSPLKKEDVDFKQLSNSLSEEIGNYLLRRLKSQVAKDLPSIKYIHEEEAMPQFQLDEYNNELLRIKKAIDNSEKGSVLSGLHNLRNISDHPMLKNYKVEALNTDELISTSSKLKTTINILNDIKDLNEKVIIFTHNKEMQRILRIVVKDEFSIDAFIINGDTPSSRSEKKANLSRQQYIDKFQAEEGFNVIIMSPIAAGFGLNVTEANHVIHYSRHWNPAKEQQATDRVYRIGQTRNVSVYYPMAIEPGKSYDTFDVIIDNLLKRKSKLASETLIPTEQIEVSQQDFVASLGFEGVQQKDVILNSIEDLDKINPINFEAAVAILLENVYEGNTFLTKISSDKGADIVLFSDKLNCLVQIKQTISKVSSSAGQEIYYSKNYYSSKCGKDFELMVITNNFYTKEAIELANENDVRLVDREELKTWIDNYSIVLGRIERKLQERLE